MKLRLGEDNSPKFPKPITLEAAEFEISLN